MVFAVQMREPMRGAGRIPCRFPPYKREAGGSNPPAPTKFVQLDGYFRTLIGNSGTIAGNHPVHAPWPEACLAAMPTSRSTALSARDASSRRERSSTVRCATEPRIGDAPGKPVTMSNLRFWPLCTLPPFGAAARPRVLTSWGAPIRYRRARVRRVSRRPAVRRSSGACGRSGYRGVVDHPADAVAVEGDAPVGAPRHVGHRDAF